MSDKSLYRFHLNLIPNLLTEFFFYIPKSEILPDIIEKVKILKDDTILDKIFVFDEYQGPVYYNKDRSYKGIILMGANLEKNIFSLLEKKNEVSNLEFDYVLNKYFEYVESMFYCTKWMHNNLNRFFEKDEKLNNIFYLQFESLRKHFKTLVKTFYKNKKTIPKGNFNAHKIIDDFFPDITDGFSIESLKDIAKLSQAPINVPRFNLPENTITTTKKFGKIKKINRKPLITEQEAERILLRTFFGITKK